MFRTALSLIALALALTGSAPTASLADDQATAAIDPRLAEFPTLTFHMLPDRIEAPDEIVAGPTVVIQEEVGPFAAHAFIFALPPDVTDEDLANVFADLTAIPGWFYTGLVGSADRAMPDRPAVSLIDFAPGRYVIGSAFRPTDQWETLTVVAGPAATPVTAAVETDAQVDLFEMAFDIPAELSAGTQLWEVSNTGAMTHEMAIFPVPAGATADEVTAAILANGDAGFFIEQTPEIQDAIAAVGPDWSGWELALAGGAGALAPQGTSIIQVDLPAGTYGAVCFFPGPDGTPHFITGMTDVFEVAPAAK